MSENDHSNRKSILLLLESPVWELSCIRRRNNIKQKRKNGIHNTKRLLDLLRIEKKTLEKPRTLDIPRRVYDEYMLNQTNKIEKYSSHITDLGLSCEEAESKSFNYHKQRLQNLAISIKYIQLRECISNNQLSKVYLRLKGYAKKLVVALHERESIDDSIGTYIWNQDKYIADTVAGGSPEEIKYPGATSFVMIIKALQLIEHFCNQNEIVEETYINKMPSCSSVVGNAMMLVRTWSDDTERILLLSQALKSLRAVLDTEIAGQRTDTMSNISSKSWSWGSASDRRLVEELTWWNNIFCHVRLYQQCPPNEVAIPLLKNYINYSDKLLSDSIRCSKSFILLFGSISHDELLQQPQVNSYEHPVYSLISTSLTLALILIHQDAFAMTSSFCDSLGDIRLVESIENEIIQILELVAAIFSIGFILEDMVEIIRLVQPVVIAHRSSLPLQSAWLQLLFSASLALILKEVPRGADFGKKATTSTGDERDSTTRSGSKPITANTSRPSVSFSNDSLTDISSPAQEIIRMLASLPTSIVETLFYHSTSATLQYFGLFVLRALFRLPFMKKKDVDDLLANQGVDDMEDIEHQKEMQAQRNKSFRRKKKGDSSSDDDDDKTTLSLASMLSNIGQAKVEQGETAAGNTDGDGEAERKPAVAVSLAGLIASCGDLHVQSDEVVEQWLLLIYHLLSYSYLAKLALSEEGVPDELDKVLFLRASSSNPYITALCEICIEILAFQDSL